MKRTALLGDVGRGDEENGEMRGPQNTVATRNGCTFSERREGLIRIVFVDFLFGIGGFCLLFGFSRADTRRLCVCVCVCAVGVCVFSSNGMVIGLPPHIH